ncbi:lipase family protein [Caballeronia sp. LZ035]|uniref:lipase family protein n=1 Tax=Caballeronia sp. LZ035 TaxID=3038568 RepID=UPI00285FD252|nr:lipase family protein [Caballeronia sp. LZ035]MDR5760885.1 lipase family protein [Caballeronia sp. LZ035]
MKARSKLVKWMTGLLLGQSILYGGAAMAQSNTDAYFAVPDSYAAFDFATWQPLWMSQANGTPLAVKAINLPDGFPGGSTGYQVLYKSTAGGKPVTVVTTLVLPPAASASALGGLTSKKGTPLISIQYPEDDLVTTSQPSYVLLNDTDPASVYAAIAAPMLDGGIAIAFPDHEGPNSEFDVGQQMGPAVLDGAQAVLNCAEGAGGCTGITPASAGGLTATSPVGLLGYSGGGGASTWAAVLHGSYAPRLNVVGAALGASSNSDLSTIVTGLDGTAEGGLAYAAIVAMGRYDPVNYTSFKRAVTGAAATVFSCMDTSAAPSSCSATGSYPAFLPTLNASGLGYLNAMLTANSVNGTAYAPDMPTLVYYDIGDTLIPSSTDFRMIQSFCKARATVQVLQSQVSLFPSQQVHDAAAYAFSVPTNYPLLFLVHRFLEYYAGQAYAGRNDCASFAMLKAAPAGTYPGQAPLVN